MTNEDAILLNRPYRTRDLKQDDAPHTDADGFVAFHESDVENPQNWTSARRWQITVCSVMLVMNATFASSAPSGALGSISSHFGVSTVVAGLTLTLFLLGYVAGPLAFAPLSEFYGRRYIFYITFLCYLAFTFLCAFAPNFGSLLVGRFLAGTFVSAPMSNVPGVLADIWNPLERGDAMAGFSMLVYIGPALGPVVAGFLELTRPDGWRWIFYVILMLGGATALLMFTIPETHAPTILTAKARRIRAQGVHRAVRSRAEGGSQTLRQAYLVALTRPWVILFDPISFLCAVYMSVVYTLLYMLFSIYPIVFQERRGWNSGVGELPLCGTIVGAVLGGAIVVLDTRRRLAAIRRGEASVDDMEPEDRLPLAMAGGILFPISMFWFAWSAEYNSVHWIVPSIAGAFLATTLLLIFTAYQNYLVDTYRMYSASAIAANTITRSACGAAAPLFTHQMFSALGVGGGGSLIAGVATVLAVIPFLFYRYGKAIRMRSPFAPTMPAPPHNPDGTLIHDTEKVRGQDEEAAVASADATVPRPAYAHLVEEGGPVISSSSSSAPSSIHRQ
ncbi:Sugar (and other) transporter [Geosmithia morbida]|uniref:Sugar (And other) transporter n=1 Tax=Geosmithia morbida TaxID=1094350 RepID=A0A9P4Z3R6_9HYPO|nr:Sugar (and other) transporter [Geosmithia morbida]KAF4126986.1 Sugar (and other) transporter [Geosmithia morbida]